MQIFVHACIAHNSDKEQEREINKR